MQHTDSSFPSGNFMERLPRRHASCRKLSGNPGNVNQLSVTPTLLPGGFTVEDAKELHEDLVRSHISQALSGER